MRSLGRLSTRLSFLASVLSKAWKKSQAWYRAGEEVITISVPAQPNCNKLMESAAYCSRRAIFALPEEKEIKTVHFLMFLGTVSHVPDGKIFFHKFVMGLSMRLWILSMPA